MSLLRTLMWQAAVLFGAGSNAACRVVQCIPDAGGSTITAQTVVGRRLAIQGRVLAIETASPIPSARIQLTTDSAWTTVDSAGAASIRVQAPGSYTLAVVAPGYAASSRIMTVRGDSGIAWIALLARSRPMRRDPACGSDSSPEATPTP